MKPMWCWRCKMEIPMLDEEEYRKAYELFGVGMENWKGGPRREAFKELLDFYRSLTGFDEIEPNAILHQRIAQYGPPCEKCGKPYRTPKPHFVHRAEINGLWIDHAGTHGARYSDVITVSFFDRAIARSKM